MYTIVYDINNTSYSDWIYDLVTVVIIIAVLIIFCIVARKIFKFSKVAIAKITVPFILLITPMIIVFNYLSYNEFKELQRAFKENRFSIAEGYVHDVKLQYGRINKQFFSVGNEEFVISDNIYTGGFNHTIQKGGPIKEGLYVKIYFFKKCCYKNIIGRLEIRNE